MKGAAHPVAQAAVESSKLGEKESFLEHLEVIFTPIKYRIESLEWRSLLQADHANDGFLDDAVRNRTGKEILAPDAMIANFEKSVHHLIAYGGAMGVDSLFYLNRVRFIDSSEFVGGSWGDLVGLAYFGRDTFSSPYVGSASILHEALHSKAQYIARGLFRYQLDENADENIEIPWWTTKNSRTYWNLSRSFDAFHVYSHISLLHASAFITEGSKESLKLCQVASFRAAFLSSLLARASSNELDEERRELVAWLTPLAIKPFGLTDEGRAIIANPGRFER